MHPGWERIDFSSQVKPVLDKHVHSNRPLLLSLESPIPHDNDRGVLFPAFMLAYEEVKEEKKKKGNIITVVKQIAKQGKVS